MPYEPSKLTPETNREFQDLNPWTLLEPLLKNRYVVVLTVVVSLLIGVFYNIYASPIYSAKSSVIIKRNITSSIIKEREADIPNFRTSLTDFNTRVKMITSETSGEGLARRLIKLGHFDGLLKQKGYDKMNDDQKAIFIRKLGNMLRGGVDVSNPKMTNIVTINYESTDPVLARDVVNLLADITVEDGEAEQLIVLENNLAYLNQQVEEARIKSRETDSKLYEYRLKNNIYETSADRELIVRRRGDLLIKLNTIQERQRESEANMDQIKSLLKRQDYTKYTAIIPEDKVQVDLSQQLVQAEIQYEELRVKYGEKHPDVVRAKQEIDILRNKFEEDLGRTLTRLEYDSNAFKSRAESLQQALDELEESAITSTEKDIEYAVLDRDATSARDMYRTLLQAVKEVQINTNTSSSNVIFVHERAIRPSFPVKPNKKLNLILSLVFGIILGTSYAFGREYLDQTIRVPEDVEKAVHLPVLSTVPLYMSKSDDGLVKSSLYVSHHPKSLFSESVTALRTHLNIKLPQERSVAIIITSSAPKEGKSLIAANLAASMALDGKRTLIIDADLHRPSIHKAFGKDKYNGVYDLIVEALNPSWSELDVADMSFGDLQHLIRLKQWSGTMRMQWDSLPSSLNISYREGKPVGSNIKDFKDRFSSGNNGFPAPQNPSFKLDESEISDLDSPDGSGNQALEFIGQYPRLRGSRYFLDTVIRRYIRDTEVENLQVLTAGTNPKNPNEILGSEQMKILLQILKERYDRIVLDCPPAWPLSDVSVLSPMIDGVLWICRAGEIPRNMFMRNIQQIQAVQPNILGVVLNAIDLQRDRYYYYGYSYYYYRYYKSDYYGYFKDGVDGKKKKSRSRRKSKPAS